MGAGVVDTAHLVQRVGEVVVRPEVERLGGEGAAEPREASEPDASVAPAVHPHAARGA